MTPALVRGHAAGLHPGWNPVLRESGGAAMDFDLLLQPPDSALDETDGRESVWVLLSGAATVQCAGETCTLERPSLFDHGPSTVSLPGATRFRSQAGREGAEWAVVRAVNSQSFAPCILRPGDVTSERRGDGLAQDACVRSVRLVFDAATRPQSQFVVGEVLCDAGRWSSYPPHAHPQPEIYHYRFSAPQGYGHAELDDDVYKVFAHDTLCIPPGKTHAQVAAAGYGMWYLWVVRHLPGAPYTGFTYRPEHTWLLDAQAQGWRAPERRPGAEGAA